ncbi:MAG: AraC family transcriptional regulator [Steroidobacteraceae bacterium]
MKTAFLTLLAAAAMALPALAADSGDTAAEPATPRSALDAEVQTLRRDVVDLNRDLFMLEEDLLFPASTQVAVFVSMDVGTFFALDSVQLKVDDKEVANYLYTGREQDALKRGGVQRLWLGNLKAGEHEVTAFFTGQGPHERDYKRGTTLKVAKGVGAKYVELQISDKASKLQPEFVVRVWE